MTDLELADLSNFGYREIEMAIDLLKAYMKGDVETGAGLQLAFNPNSGYVFLTDEDYNAWMLNDDKLEQHFSCSECGNEGFREEFKGSKCKECKRIFKGDE